jgi:hypothetical protein
MDVVTGTQVAIALTVQIPCRLATLCRDMTTTIGAMVTADTAIGATR